MTINCNNFALKSRSTGTLILPPGSSGGLEVVPVPPPEPEPISIIELLSNIVSYVCVKIPCCCDPCVKLQFSSNIITTGFTGTLIFHVSKLCGSNTFPIPLKPTWQYSRITDTSSSTLSFFMCDYVLCQNEHCTYIVRVGVLGPPTVGTVQINAPSISIFTICQD